MSHIDIVFDGPPGPDAGRLIDVDDENGKSIDIGVWVKRDDEFWVLRVDMTTTLELAVLKEALKRCAEQFRFYENQHLAKNTPNADVKAEANRAMAVMCEVLIK
jgi:hypothetical protein